MVPNNLEDLMKLPGLSKYSSRAVLCLGFRHPTPMVDEGVGRVYRRVVGINSTQPDYKDKKLKEYFLSFYLGTILLSKNNRFHVRELIMKRTTPTA